MEPNYASPHHEWWPRPSDGRMVPLVVQTASDPSLLPPTSRWTRLGKPVSQVTLLLRLTNWVGSSLFIPGTRDYRTDIGSLTLTAMKFLASWPLFCVLVCWQEPMGTDHTMAYGWASFSATGLGVRRQTHRAGSYRSFQGLDPYNAFVSAGNMAAGRQYLDNIRMDDGLVPSLPSQSQPRLIHNENETAHQGDSTASIRPRYLCLVKDFHEGTYETINVSEYLAENGDDIDLEFVFVSYTRMHFRVATDDEISGYDYPDEETREANRTLAKRDRETLARWGMDAAKRVRKKAFWLDFECVRNDDGVARSTSSSEDVYRICDIVRAAHSMIIAIGPTASEKVSCLLTGGEPLAYSREQVTPWLRQWGSRLWTLPELLLCPAEYRIRLYVAGDPSEPKPLAKRNFAERAWDDAEAVKELVNHFEGSAILTSLNLIEAALRCFSRRQTDQFSQGDIAYAIMGLFPSRLRPQVNKEDTGFQAFAKLSLANDSGAFLDRLICLSPPSGAPWHHTQDQWGARPGDIQPLLSVQGVSGCDTVILSGVYAATILWDRIDPEPYGDRSMGQFQHLVVFFSFFCCTAVPFLLMLSTYVWTFTPIDPPEGFPDPPPGWEMPKPPEGFPDPPPVWPPFDLSDPFMPFKAFMAAAFSMIGVFAFILPVVFIRSRRNPKRPFVPRLIGIEGFMDVGDVEYCLWGLNHGNLADTSSQSYSDTAGNTSEVSSTPQAEGSFCFTLVDTHLLTVTHLRCDTPPVAFFVCGQEGGMHRTMLCSYDSQTQTYHRQATLRTNRRPLEPMRLMDQVSVSIGSHPTGLGVTETSPLDCLEPDNLTVSSRNSRLKAEERPSRWKMELLFLAICLFSINIFEPYDFDSQSENLFNYKVFFVGGQTLCLVVLSKLPLNLTFPYVFLSKISVLVVEAVKGKEFTGVNIRGAFDGWLFSTLFVLIWAWYPLNELALRFLLIAVAVPQAEVLWEGVVPRVLSFRIFIVILHFIFLLTQIMIGMSRIIGQPAEVFWLDACQMIAQRRLTAMKKLSDDSTSWNWKRPKIFVRSLARVSLIFAVTLITSILFESRDNNFHDDTSLGAVYMVVVVLVGLVTSCKPLASYAIMAASCLVPSIVMISRNISQSWSYASLPLRVLVNLSQVVLPLLWSTILQRSQSWVEAAGTISLSCIGAAVGQILVQYNTTVHDMTFRLGLYLPLLVIQSIIWALIWVDGYLGRRGTRFLRRPSAEGIEARLAFTDIHS